jgi:hypothetical protein
MARAKSLLGYIAAELSVFAMFATLPALVILPQPFISATGLKTFARYSGGEVVRTVEHGAYHTQVHRMVFDALLGEAKTGFIQVGWAPPDGLPAQIDEEIDADGDEQVDLRVTVDTLHKTATVKAYAPWVLEVEGTYRLTTELAVRIRLRNPK